MSATSGISVVDSTTDSGDGDWNEDVIGWNRSRAWVIDGGTDLPQTLRPDPETSGSFWISRKLNEALMRAPAQADLKKVFSRFSESVRSRLHPLRQDNLDGVSPICSVAVVERSQEDILVSRVGDVTVYFPSIDLEVGEHRFGLNEGSGVAKDGPSSRTSILGRRRGYLRGMDDLWVLGDNPRVSEGVAQIVVPGPYPQRALLVSDGMARAVDAYGIYSDWGDFAVAIAAEGARATMAYMREFESRSGAARVHYKARDDASLLMIYV